MHLATEAHEMEMETKGEWWWCVERPLMVERDCFWRARLFCRRQSGVYGLPFREWRESGG